MSAASGAVIVAFGHLIVAFGHPFPSHADGPSALILKKMNFGKNCIDFSTISLIIHDLINYSWHPPPFLHQPSVLWWLYAPFTMAQRGVAAISIHPFSSKIAIFGILANFEVIFRGEGVEISKIWAHLPLKGNSRAVQISNQIWNTPSRFWDIAR